MRPHTEDGYPRRPKGPSAPSTSTSPALHARLSCGPAGLAVQWATGREAHSEVLTVSGVLRLGGLRTAVCRGGGGSGAVGLGFTDQRSKGVIRIHHFQRLQTERMCGHIIPVPGVRGNPFVAKKAQLNPRTVFRSMVDALQDTQRARMTVAMLCVAALSPRGSEGTHGFHLLVNFYGSTHKSASHQANNKNAKQTLMMIK